MHVFSFLFYVIFNLALNSAIAVPSNQAKLANEGNDGDTQESNLPMFEKFLTEFSTEMMKNIENIRNWDIIKDTGALVSTNEGISSFFVDSNLNDDFMEVTYKIDRSKTITRFLSSPSACLTSGAS